MPTQKEIAEWLREAAEHMTTHGLNFGHLFFRRAALVESMRCKMCTYGDDCIDYSSCSLFDDKFPIGFGCFMWESKEKK